MAQIKKEQEEEEEESKKKKKKNRLQADGKYIFSKIFNFDV